MAFVVPLVFIAGAAVIGIVSGAFTGCEDCPVEEVAEEIIENQGETLLGLDHGDLNLDLSPNSPEEIRLKPFQRECIRNCGCYKTSNEMNE